jgi:hypothetical protein
MEGGREIREEHKSEEWERTEAIQMAPRVSKGF